MHDDFDTFLANALAPTDRPPDRKFVSKVQLAVALDAELVEARRALVRRLGQQVMAVVAVGAGLVVLVRSDIGAALISDYPAASLTAVAALFVLIIAALVEADRGERTFTLVNAS